MHVPRPRQQVHPRYTRAAALVEALIQCLDDGDSLRVQEIGGRRPVGTPITQRAVPPFNGGSVQPEAAHHIAFKLRDSAILQQRNQSVTSGCAFTAKLLEMTNKCRRVSLEEINVRADQFGWQISTELLVCLHVV